MVLLRLSVLICMCIIPLVCAFCPILLDSKRASVERALSLSLAASSSSSANDNGPIPRPGDRPPPQGGDMAYIKQNIDRQFHTYDSIVNVGGVDCVADVYAQSKRTQPTVFWFVGKAAYCGSVSLEQAVNRQWNLLEEHVVRLRPVELGREFGHVDFWTAPGNSELDCAEGKVNLQPVQKQQPDSCDGVSLKEVGCNLEVVTNEGVGFFIERNDDGTIM